MNDEESDKLFRKLLIFFFIVMTVFAFVVDYIVGIITK